MQHLWYKLVTGRITSWFNPKQPLIISVEIFSQFQRKWLQNEICAFAGSFVPLWSNCAIWRQKLCDILEWICDCLITLGHRSIKSWPTKSVKFSVQFSSKLNLDGNISLKLSLQNLQDLFLLVPNLIPKHPMSQSLTFSRSLLENVFKIFTASQKYHKIDIDISVKLLPTLKNYDFKTQQWTALQNFKNWFFIIV